jgi:hypothetical protein
MIYQLKVWTQSEPNNKMLQNPRIRRQKNVCPTGRNPLEQLSA